MPKKATAKRKPAWITTQEAADIIGIGVARVKAICAEGRLKTKRVPGRAGKTYWAITRKSAESFAKQDRPRGGPIKKAKT